MVQKLSDLSRNEAFLKVSVEELNGDLKRKIEPPRAGSRANQETIGRDRRRNRALCQSPWTGKALGRALEAEIGGPETDKHILQQQLDDLQRKINESAARDFNAEILQQTLRNFRSAFAALDPPEQTEALQCVLKSVAVHPQKLEPEIFELEEFLPGSQNRKEWLPGLDSN